MLQWAIQSMGINIKIIYFARPDSYKYESDLSQRTIPKPRSTHLDPNQPYPNSTLDLLRFDSKVQIESITDAVKCLWIYHIGAWSKHIAPWTCISKTLFRRGSIITSRKLDWFRMYLEREVGFSTSSLELNFNQKMVFGQNSFSIICLWLVWFGLALDIRSWVLKLEGFTWINVQGQFEI